MKMYTMTVQVNLALKDVSSRIEGVQGSSYVLPYMLDLGSEISVNPKMYA